MSQTDTESALAHYIIILISSYNQCSSLSIDRIRFAWKTHLTWTTLRRRPTRAHIGRRTNGHPSRRLHGSGNALCCRRVRIAATVPATCSSLGSAAKWRLRWTSVDRSRTTDFVHNHCFNSPIFFYLLLFFPASLLHRSVFIPIAHCAPYWYDILVLDLAWLFIYE